MKVKFSIPEEFSVGIARLLPLLDCEEGDDILVRAEASDRTGVTLHNGEAIIYYTKKHLFFRELSVLLTEAKEKDSFEWWEDGHFETVSTMIDTSRCAVPTVKTVKNLIDRLVLMGYGMVMLYTEDVLTLPNRPYFGYMRGRYTPEELRAVDDYAFEYGIEVIPCLECYGHMEKYLMWKEASPIKDTARVLLAREEKTFDFLDELIGTVSACFRSRRIHIGMDEAWDMGRGKFLDRNGYVPAFEIFNEYMERLISITRKYGLRPMMWSDMYFRVCHPKHKYCAPETEIPPEVAKRIPAEVELVFWHYGEEYGSDDYMLKKHKALNRSVIFAGGLWSWIGHFPEHYYTMDCTKQSLLACRANDVREAMATLWTNDNAECDWYTNLFGLSYFAELCYDKDPTEEKLRRRFHAVSGGNYDAFLLMSDYHNKDLAKDYENYSHRFLGKPLFWQDIMEGLYDSHLEGHPMSSHYAEATRRMAAYADAEGEWQFLYSFAAKVFDYMGVKTLIAENLVSAYKRGDRALLSEIAEILLPALKDAVIRVHEAHKAIWFKHNKIIGWSNLDVRYAGVAARCDTAKALIEAYLAGELDSLEKLDEPRLHKPLDGFVQYSAIATPNLKT
ncbi:MAG: beta-N-acetylhexosaminidase [Clostridia bacterium]|nr:beta-N-acetylhexosaminidase [Clostridia bacterium]